MRPRDHQLERHLHELAARAAGFLDGQGRGDDGGLRAFADRRAHPGGVRADLDGVREASEEVADAASYLCWDIERLWPLVQAGDPDASERYARLLQALSHLVSAWYALHTPHA